MLEKAGILGTKLTGKMLHDSIDFLRFAGKSEQEQKIAHRLDQWESAEILQPNKVAENFQVEILLFAKEIANCRLKNFKNLINLDKPF